MSGFFSPPSCLLFVSNLIARHFFFSLFDLNDSFAPGLFVLSSDCN